MRQLLIVLVAVLALASPVFAQQTVNTELPAAAALADNTANPTTPSVGAYLMCYDGSTWDRCTSDSQGTHDTTLGTLTSVTGGLLMGRSSAAAPTDVSADGDAVLPWYLRSGALAIQPTFSGTLAVGGSGTISAGVQRVTIATDDPVNDALVKLDGAISGTEVQVDVVAALPAGDNDIGNVDLELAGTAVSASNPVSVRLSNGTSAISQRCADDSKVTSVVISTASSGNTELVALTSSQVVYVCGYDIVATGAVSFQFIYGTGTACATGETDLTGAMPFAANGGISRPNGGAVQFKGAASNALCMELSSGVQVDGVLTYVKE